MSMLMQFTKNTKSFCEHAQRAMVSTRLATKEAAKRFGGFLEEGGILAMESLAGSMSALGLAPSRGFQPAFAAQTLHR